MKRLSFLRLLRHGAVPLLSALTVCLLFNTPAAAADPAPKIGWSDDVSVLKQTKFDKPVLLRFSAVWCGPCRAMDKEVWPNAEVVEAVNKNYLPVEIDIDRPETRPVSEQFKISVIPTIVVLDQEGREIARTHFMSVKETLAFLKDPAAHPATPQP